VNGDGNEPETGPEPEPDVGTAAEEAAKLFSALADWARDQGSDLGHSVAGLAGHAARTMRDVDSHLATGAEECTYCPICRTVHVVRQTSPEVRAQLATAATALLQAASGLLATAVPDQREHRTGVEHIDLDEGPEGWPDEGDEHTDPEEGDR
jgi:hypothetical protein